MFPKAQDIEKCPVIGIVEKDFYLGIATRGYVVQGTGIFYPDPISLREAGPQRSPGRDGDQGVRFLLDAVKAKSLWEDYQIGVA